MAALIAESKFFIEWTAAEADPERRRQLGDEARAWSDGVLQLSGLMQ